MEAGREKQDSCDLQICFMNDIASDDESSETVEEAEGLAEAIVRANISQKEGQIIVPMVGGQVVLGGQGGHHRPTDTPSKEELFRRQVRS